MKPFLKSVADAYLSRYDDLSRFLFVFPGKRAAAFFRNHISTSIPKGKYIMEPEMITVSDLTERLSGLVADNHIDLLLRLFSIYRRISPEGGKDFTKFRRWGDTALSDFSDVMMYRVDPEMIFSNLVDYKNTRTDYLTDEQKSLVKEYFPDAHFPDAVKSFWAHFNNGTPQRKTPFLALWEVMARLLDEFNASLKADGLSYPGLALAEALERLQNFGRELLPHCDRIVFVGFNALSTLERAIFTEFLKMRDDDGNRFADFYWDIPGDVVENASAGRFVRPNAKRFPSLFDISSSDAPGIPDDISIIAAPSRTAQTQIIKSVIDNWLKEGVIDKNKLLAAKVAVVLPDEGLLMPLIHSIPEDMESVNLTMGYPLKQSLAGSLVQNIVTAYRASRVNKDGKFEFYYRHILDILAHPYLTLLFPEFKIRKLREKISSFHRIMLSKEYVTTIFPDLEKFLIDAPKDSPIGALEALVEILVNVRDRLPYGKYGVSDPSSAMIHVRDEQKFIGGCIDAVRLTSEALRRYEISTKAADALALLHSMLDSFSVRFEGEPLKGLQIIGALETRMLDFDYLIIPSLNEGKYPVTIRKNSLIPEALRRGYGLSTSRFRESMYAYNFYRLIARAKKVVLIYDSRLDELSTGAPSRYLAQLRTIYARDKIKNSTAILGGDVENASYDDTGDYSSLALPFFSEGSGRYFSASAINRYISCPLAFFAESLCSITELEEPDEYLSSSNFGTVLHETLREIYPKATPLQGVKITAEYLEDFINHPEKISRLIHKYIHLLHIRDIDKDSSSKQVEDAISRPLTNDLEALASQMLNTVIDTLRYDISKTPFNYFGSELKIEGSFELPGCGRVNLKAKIDRIDDIGGEIRIVDYKSGRASIKKSGLQALFEKSDHHQELQLALYSFLFFQSGIMPSLSYYPRAKIYPLINIGGDESDEEQVFKSAEPSFSPETHAGREEYFKEFSTGLGNLLLKIKDGEESYNPPENSVRGCEYCLLADSVCPTGMSRKSFD